MHCTVRWLEKSVWVWKKKSSRTHAYPSKDMNPTNKYTSDHTTSLHSVFSFLWLVIIFLMLVHLHVNNFRGGGDAKFITYQAGQQGELHLLLLWIFVKRGLRGCILGALLVMIELLVIYVYRAHSQVPLILWGGPRWASLSVPCWNQTWCQIWHPRGTHKLHLTYISGRGWGLPWVENPI